MLHVQADDSDITLDKKLSELTKTFTEAGRRNLKSGALKDGWWLTWDGDEWGDTFEVEAHRTVGAQRYTCRMSALTANERKAGLAACLSLRPAK